MSHPFSRTELIYGHNAMEKLAASRVAIFGIGGVGGYTLEALARSGVGQLDLIDNDKICLTNLNRQILATRETLGRYKVDAAAERVKSINPDCVVRTYRTFYLPETQGEFDFTQYDYVVDAIDTVSGKLALIQQAQAAGTPIISAMGAGNKVDPGQFRVADLYETRGCPLARIMRRECRRRGIQRLKVVYSPEKPVCPSEEPGEEEPGEKECPPEGRRTIPGSTAFVPAAAGLLIAGEVVKDLTGFSGEGRL